MDGKKRFEAGQVTNLPVASPGRRRLLQGAAGSLLLPLCYNSAFAQSGTALLRAPKLALVIGNSKYAESPLKNPANDARAIAEQLKGLGFAVSVQQDLGREPMIKAIQAYAALLAKSKAVGLFYYAGHGVQLSWRNFLVPVDAVIDKLEAIQKRCVDVGALVEGITKAANPMNVVILDACRDNPFGNERRVEQRGLSQLDAPPGTLLAYATAPGNVASDGDGANGLYTENLLRELKVPEAKIEDVFKRVRLGVRRKSNGQQIPWESTSLEEDFYFLPPEYLKKLSEDEKKKLFEQELSLWESIKSSKVPAPLEDYLRRYPSGEFAELAQLQLDRALAREGEKKIRIASQEGNPYTKGSAEADTAYKVGDRYTYRRLDMYSKAETGRVSQTVAKITDNEVIFNRGGVTDLLGNPLRANDGRRFSPHQRLPLEYALGKQWHTRFRVTFPNGELADTELALKITARERIDVPAGTFDAFRVEIDGVSYGRIGNVRVYGGFWRAPAVRLPIVRIDHRVGGWGTVAAERYELVSFKQG